MPAVSLHPDNSNAKARDRRRQRSQRPEAADATEQAIYQNRGAFPPRDECRWHDLR